MATGMERNHDSDHQKYDILSDRSGPTSCPALSLMQYNTGKRREQNTEGRKRVQARPPPPPPPTARHPRFHLAKTQEVSQKRATKYLGIESVSLSVCLSLSNPC